jgi:putative endonuclease
MTNDLSRRLFEHNTDAVTSQKHFTGKYKAKYLIYYERFEFVEHAIEREKQLKGWVRKRKIELIESFNPTWKFLNNEINDN